MSSTERHHGADLAKWLVDPLITQRPGRPAEASSGVAACTESRTTPFPSGAALAPCRAPRRRSRIAGLITVTLRSVPGPGAGRCPAEGSGRAAPRCSSCPAA